MGLGPIWSTLGSLTAWLVNQTSQRQGWGPQGIEIVPMGIMPGQIAALKRGDIDGVIMDIGNAFDLEKKGEGRILVRFGDIKDFIIHVIYATNKAIANRPNDLRNFVKGYVAQEHAVMREVTEALQASTKRAVRAKSVMVQPPQKADAFARRFASVRHHVPWGKQPVPTG